jgi:AraC-like DNA-binding protein
MLSACARLGLDTSQILRAAGLDRATLENPDVRLPAEQVDALWRNAYELSGDPNLALHAIEVLPFGAYRVIDFLASSAPTIGMALAKVSDYFPLIRNGEIGLPYAVTETQVTVGLEAPTCPAAISRPYAEYTLAAVFLRTRTATNQRYPLIRVEFSHPQPEDISEHERIFECPVVFGAATCQLVIARDVWDTPRIGSDPALFSVLDAHAKLLLDQLPNPAEIVSQVRQAIESELRGGHPQLESIARRLVMTPRTLQRRLRDQGLVFNDVLDAMRFRAARTYLAQPDVAVAEVAYLLGFAEQSSFNRAFRRWSGQTPTEYRRRAAGP